MHAAKQLYDLRRNIPAWYDLMLKMVRPGASTLIPKGPVVTGQLVVELYWYHRDTGATGDAEVGITAVRH